MKSSSKVSEIRALASAGLPAEAFISAALGALHAVIPSDRNLFDWTDADGRLIRYFFEGPIDHQIAKHYFEEFHNRRELEVMPAFRDIVTGRASVLCAAQLDRPEFYRSALYNEIWRPQRLQSRIETIVRRSDGSPLGSLVLYRGPGDRKFTLTEERLLQQVAPYIARGMLAQPASFDGSPYATRPSEQAYMCLSPSGVLTQYSVNAQRLLMLAHGDLTPEHAGQSPSLVAFPALGALLRQWQGQRDSMRGASLQVKNQWGLFVFEACGMAAAASAGEMTLHVTLSHREFHLISMRRAVNSFDLSPAQREVCLLLHAGLSQADVAVRLGLAPATVVDHVRKIYAKLDVHSTLELVNLINERKENMA